jgi:hypothetical protein
MWTFIVCIVGVLIFAAVLLKAPDAPSRKRPQAAPQKQPTPTPATPHVKLVEPPRRALKIELIPWQMSGINARAVLTREAWDAMRGIVHDHHGWKCAECQSEHRLECHEVWDYAWDRRNGKNVPVMRLAGLRTLCRRCHQGKHIKFVESRQPDELAQVRRHLMQVYGLSETALDERVSEAVAQVKQKHYNYRLDLTYLNQERFAAMHALIGRTFDANENRNCRKPGKDEDLAA